MLPADGQVRPPVPVIPRDAVAEDSGTGASTAYAHAGERSVLRCGIRLAGGAIALLLPPQRPAELLRGIAVCAVPNVPRWFIGMANLRGELVPVFDLLDHLGIAVARSLRAADLLVVGTGASAFAIPVASEPEVLTLTVPSSDAPPPEAALAAFVSQAWLGPEGYWYDFEFDRWLRCLASADG